VRLRQRDLKTVYVRPWTTKKDIEGCTTNDYGIAFEVKASIQPLSGQVASTEYGETLKYMLSMKVDSLGAIKEKDGICVYVAPEELPDYEVISIRPWAIPVIEIKKRGA
jgi:hypothetical protein